MVIKKLEDAFVLRLEMGEELIEALENFADKYNINGAFFHGIGGATSAQLGIYRVDTDKKYHYKDFAGPLEIISINGDISTVEDGSRFVHAHATISGPDLNVSGGHVKEIQIGATCELFVDLRTGDLSRKLDENIGLKLLDLND